MKATKKTHPLFLVTLTIVSLLMLTACGSTAKTVTLIGTYIYGDSYIWFDEYQKNLVGVENQTLNLFDDGTYVLSMDYRCVANMDIEIVTGAKYDAFYSSRMAVTGKYEVISEADEFGTMEIKLVDATLSSVSGNFEGVWPLSADGDNNFDITISNTNVTLDANAMTIEDSIPMFSLKN